MGAALAIYSLMTDYGSDKPFGGVRVLSMKQHLPARRRLRPLGRAVAVGLRHLRKGWNYWAPQTLAMSSELFFALTTELDPD